MHRHRAVPRLPLRRHIARAPARKARRARCRAVGCAARRAICAALAGRCAAEFRKKRGVAGIRRQRGALFGDQPPEFLNAEARDQKLDARPPAVLLFAEPRKDPGHGLHLGQQFALRRELREHLRLVRHRAEPAAHHHLEAALSIPQPRHKSRVVHLHQPAGGIFAARKSGLELAPEVLHIRVAEQKVHERRGVGRNIECLAAAHPRQRAGGDIAHRIAAGFAGGNAHRRQPPHQVRRVFNVDEVKLEILPRGHMQNLVRILLGQIGQGFQLLGRKPAEGDFDALHARRIPDRVRPLGGALRKVQAAHGNAVVAPPVVVALPIHAAPQPGFGKRLLVQLARAAQFQLRFEVVNLAGPAVRNAARQGILPPGCAHQKLLPRGSRAARPQT